MKRKITGLLLAFSLVTALLTGCGGKDADDDITNNSGNSSSSSSGKEEQEENEEKYIAEYGEFYLQPENGVLNIPNIGVKIELPKELKDKEDRIAVAGFLDERFAYAVIHMINTDDEYDIELGLVTIIGDTFPIDRNDYVNDDAGISYDIMYDLGTNGSLYYIAADMGQMYDERPDVFDFSIYSEDQKNEYFEMLKYTNELVDNITLTELVLPSNNTDAYDGDELLNITVLDLDRNPVLMKDYISSNKVTMINVWGTFCGPCIREMPSLVKLANKYRDQGFEIVGVTGDILQADGSYSSVLIQDARDIMEDTGVNYSVVIATPEILQYVQLAAYPTTIFVDRNGKILLDPIVGSNNEEQWERLINEALEAAD